MLEGGPVEVDLNAAIDVHGEELQVLALIGHHQVDL
jgi:hypothetical protein